MQYLALPTPVFRVVAIVVASFVAMHKRQSTPVAAVVVAVFVASAEAELGALFINSKQAVLARNTLEEMGHSQPPTPIQTNSTTAIGVVNKKNQMNQTKSMDMQFHWMRDRENKKQFRYYWGAR